MHGQPDVTDLAVLFGVSGRHRFVALAAGIFEMLSIQNPDDAAAAPNGSLLLKSACRNRN
jgi:hypothetical protein